MILTESTVAVLGRIALVVAESTAPKFVALISEGVQVVPQRSAAHPYVTVFKVVPQVVPVIALFVPTTDPPFTNLTMLSLTPRPRVFADHCLFICTVIPFMVAPDGMLKP